ncbi:patatin-like phospholipase family protein [Cohnella abietis]|uniref:Phospholipase n=1 Tax=Cohnella abietis TaxID=2507935 RepID=A0A3T1D4N7_9BACL|nr:patatin-like phospholipase family protein [Cohnella abietis]BBI33057.1 phospholipase [Cohnella abietis]
MQTTSVNAVFEGGGVKGISLTGAVRAAELCGIDFHQVAGTSSGSIVAALLAAGYTALEMKEAIESMPFRRLLKRNPIFNTKFIGPAVRLFLCKGLYSGDALEQWVEDLLKAKQVKNFGDLPPGKLRIIASDITNGRLLVLPQDISQYGISPQQLSIARAVRMSTSIPYFFDPVIFKQPLKERKKNVVKTKFSYVVDGGLLSNFPLWLFEDDVLAGEPVPIIGFQMVGRSEAHPHQIIGPISMFQAMFDTMLSAHDERYIEKHNIIRTIKIPALGVSSTEFNLTHQKSAELYASGLSAGEKFFQSWNRKQGNVKITIANNTKAKENE